MSLTPSRRRLLQAGALVPLLSACTSKPARPHPADPDVALREGAIARERALLAQYDAAAGGSPARAAALRAVRLDHEAHLAALTEEAPTSASPSPSAAAAGPAPTTAQLVAAEHAAAAAAGADALVASRPLAALLASVAASEASHV